MKVRKERNMYDENLFHQKIKLKLGKEKLSYETKFA